MIVGNILSPLRSLHADEYYKIVHLPCNTLCTSEYRSLMVKEVKPEMNAIPLRTLVKHIAELIALLLFSEGYKFTEYMMLIYTQASK